MDPETLIAHAGFLRSLAGELLADASAADDVLQEAWLASARKPPTDPGRIRAWLSVVVAPPAERALEKQELVRAVVDAVFGLDEPYRTTVVLRFYENRKPSAIAREMGVPVETVRTRLKRALAELRRRLESQTGGDRRSLGFALLGAFRPDLPATPLAGALAMGSTVKLLVATGVAVLLAAPVVLVMLRAADDRAEPDVSRRSAAGRLDPDVASATDTQRVAVPAADEASLPAGSAVDDRVARGTVRDRAGAPLAGASVRIALNFASPDAFLEVLLTPERP